MPLKHAKTLYTAFLLLTQVFILRWSLKRIISDFTLCNFENTELFFRGGSMNDRKRNILKCEELLNGGRHYLLNSVYSKEDRKMMFRGRRKSFRGFWRQNKQYIKMYKEM